MTPELRAKLPARCLMPIRARSTSIEAVGPLYRGVPRLRRVVYPVCGRLPRRGKRPGAHNLHSAQPRLCRHLCDYRTRCQPPNRLWRRGNRRNLVACIQACRSCADECEIHAEHGMEHCRVCAEECRRCERACQELLAATSGRSSTARSFRDQGTQSRITHSWWRSRSGGCDAGPASASGAKTRDAP